VASITADAAALSSTDEKGGEQGREGEREKGRPFRSTYIPPPGASMIPFAIARPIPVHPGSGAVLQSKGGRKKKKGKRRGGEGDKKGTGSSTLSSIRTSSRRAETSSGLDAGRIEAGVVPRSRA